MELVCPMFIYTDAVVTRKLWNICLNLSNLYSLRNIVKFRARLRKLAKLRNDISLLKERKKMTIISLFLDSTVVNKIKSVNKYSQL